MKKKKDKIVFLITAGMLLFFGILTRCGIFSPQGASLPSSPVTVTVTVTETVTTAVSETPEPEISRQTVAEDIPAPPGQAYNIEGGFTDIDKHPDKEHIITLAQESFITGFDDGTFRPGTPITRGEYLLWLYNASGRKTILAKPDTPSFPDLPKGHWLYEIVEGMVQVGGFQGYPDNTFRPDNPLNRQEWCVMNCFFGADPQLVIDTVDTFPEHFKLSNYNDPDKVGKASQKFVEYACSALWCEKTFGRPLKKIPFEPEKAVTRAEAAKWISIFKESLLIY